ncbi:4-hydroxythreonine-4-phosphate dehydrogenase [uncultured Gammaproteobacteria bacterium]
MTKTDTDTLLALTMGEPAGIGGDITLAAWVGRRRQPLPPFVVLDDPDRLAALARLIGVDVPIQVVASTAEAVDCFDQSLPVLPVPLAAPNPPGQLVAANAAAVLASLDLGIALIRSGQAAALVTNPFQKAHLYRAGFRHPGHTEYLAAKAGAGIKPVMMLVGDRLRVVPVTIHVPLRSVPELLSFGEILHCLRITAAALVSDFGLPRPRLAVAGLNPHAGEDGTIGQEEIEIIAPAVAQARFEGIDAVGPLPADTLFHDRARGCYDGVICMYHDQALIPVKTVSFDTGVNVTLGLPFVRTSPDHGTALDLAGSGKANPSSLIAALILAGTIANNRRRHQARLKP